MPLMNEISPALRKTINSSPFVLHPQRYTILQVQECSNPQPHFLVTHEAEEVTVITTEKQRACYSQTFSGNKPGSSSLIQNVHPF